MFGFCSFFLIIASLAMSVSSQSIDPSSVPLSTREKWCTDQKASCPLLCLQINATIVPSSNDCTASSLAFSCVCSNGLQPNASEYSQTIPYYECTTANSQCADNCGTNPSCAAACQTDHPCGAQNPRRINTSTITTVAATSTGAAETGTAINTGFLGQATSSTNDAPRSVQASTIDLSVVYGLILMLALVSSGFTLML